jgi:hypothetical protein
MQRVEPYLYFWAIVLAVIGLSLAVAYFREMRRREQLERVALETGFAYGREGTPLDVAGLTSLELLGRGRSHQYSNILRGSGAGTEMQLFDFKYTTGSGRNRSTHRLTVAAFRLRAEVPQFTLDRENLFHKLISALGYQDIDLEAHPQFSARYLLRGKDAEAIRRFFHPGLVAFFESPEKHEYTVEGGGAWLILYQSNQRSDAGKLREYIDQRAQYATGILAQAGNRMSARF